MPSLDADRIVSDARSFLFVPGDRPDRFDKARSAGADVVIFDLEDAVSPSSKASARALVTAALDPLRPVLVRINGVDTPWFADDIALGYQAGVLGLMLPKAEAGSLLKELASRHTVVPLIESARGVLDLAEIAAIPGVVRLSIGEIDLALDIGLPGPGLGFEAIRIQMVVASRAAGRAAPVAGVTPTFRGRDPTFSDTAAARAGGFGAKLCIHPAQVEIVHEAFRATVEEIEWAERVLAATPAADGHAVAVDGQMIDRPVLERARRLIARRR